LRRKAYLSPTAEADLGQIWAYIARDSPRAADRFLLRLRRQCEVLARSPGIGRIREEVRPGLRSFPVGRYVIFYHEAPGGIGVARVLSGYRDLETEFDE